MSTIFLNLGIKARNIQKVKEHVFLDEHLLDRYFDYGIPAEMRRFDRSLSQGEAWLGFEENTHTSKDKELARATN